MDYPRNAPIFRILQPWKNFDRAGIFFWMFIFASVFVIIGIASELGRFLLWIGGLVLVIYVFIFLASAWNQM